MTPLAGVAALALGVLAASSAPAGAAEPYPSELPLRAALGAHGGLAAGGLAEIIATRLSTDQLAGLHAFYRGRGYRPLWVGERGPQHSTFVLLQRLRNADRDGLDPDVYAPAALLLQLAASSPKSRAELELALSAALVRYARDLSIGRAGLETAGPFPLPAQTGIEATHVLRSAARADDLGRFLDRLVPASPAYQRLRRLLHEHREIAAHGGWPPVPPGAALRAGDRDPRVVALRARLHASGDLASAPADPQLFDAGLAHAVRRFQARHGLHTDGVVGANTLAAMNIPVEARLRQIALNLERMRSAPATASRRQVVVNVAAQELEVIEDGARVLAMRVVVGQPARPTPLFFSRLTHLVLNPYWNVPPRIASRDLLPKVQVEPAHLVEQGFRVLSDWTGDAIELDPLAIDWSAFGDALPFKLRQDPGPANALGQIKFMLPNPYDVYLHDTPSRHLFAREVRAFSSGCIRLEAPIQLALYLLERGGWSEAGLRREIATGITKAIHLPEPVPIALTYATAWADEEGRAHFRDDIYGFDASLAQHLFVGDSAAGGVAARSGTRLSEDSAQAAAGTPRATMVDDELAP